MLTIRPAAAPDVPLILALIRELAAYEREPAAVVATEADLLRDGFGPEPAYRCLLADWGGEPAGFALYCHSYSTWQGRKGLWLEDLFVRPEHRGRGIGTALLRRLARTALDEGCGRFQWQVLDWNETALRFYDALGARKMSEWLTMRVEGDRLLRLAGG